MARRPRRAVATDREAEIGGRMAAGGLDCLCAMRGALRTSGTASAGGSWGKARARASRPPHWSVAETARQGQSLRLISLSQPMLLQQPRPKRARRRHFSIGPARVSCRRTASKQRCHRPVSAARRPCKKKEGRHTFCTGLWGPNSCTIQVGDTGV
jgi:hypothetical protein